MLYGLQKTEASSGVPDSARGGLANDDYAAVKTFLERAGAPFYDPDLGVRVNGTPVVEITDHVQDYASGEAEQGRGGSASAFRNIRFFLKEEYRNPLTSSVKGRAVASMVLNSIRRGEIYGHSGHRKKWVEPTSGNTGKGLAEVAKLLGVEFTAVFSRLDVSEDIKRELGGRFGGRMVTIGSEYSLKDLENLARRNGKTVRYYWTMPGPMNRESESIFARSLEWARARANSDSTSENQESLIKNLDSDFFIQSVLSPATEALRAPLVARIEKGEFADLKEEASRRMPELNDQAFIVGLLCPQGNTSMAVNTLFNQLGFENVCSVNGGLDSLARESAAPQSSSEKNVRGPNNNNGGAVSAAQESAEFCPLPGSSISTSSIDFVKRLVADNSEEYFTFMQYDNIENVNAHVLTTGPELKQQIPDLGAVVCTFGTGGTATGLASYFANVGVEVYASFPERPVEGIRTLRGAEGLEFFKPETYAGIIETDNAAVHRALRFFVGRGLNIGPSTAVAIEAARSLADEGRGRASTSPGIAIIAADGIENYRTEYAELMMRK